MPLRDVFLSTLSLRRATHPQTSGHPHNTISIHALLAESDVMLVESSSDNRHFYPRSPCGERHMIHLLLCNAKPYFYPRSPCGERPWDWFFTGTLDPKFLSTLSLRRATSPSTFFYIILQNFYPRSPCGERPITNTAKSKKTKFLSTLSLRRATRRFGL